MKDEVKIKIIELKMKIQIIPKENLFDFTKTVEERKEEKYIDLGVFHELAEETKFIYDQAPVNTRIEDMEKLKKEFFPNGFFSPGYEVEIDTKNC